MLCKSAFYVEQTYASEEINGCSLGYVQISKSYIHFCTNIHWEGNYNISHVNQNKIDNLT